MHPDQIRTLLEEVQAGVRTIDQALQHLAQLPFGDLGNARVDHHRALRCGFAEVVFCAGKEPRDVVRIVDEGLRLTPCMLATRAEPRHAEALRERFPNALVNLRGHTVRVGTAPALKTRGSVLVVTAGTSDIPVAEEALETLRAFGCEARRRSSASRAWKARCPASWAGWSRAPSSRCPRASATAPVSKAWPRCW